MADDHLRAGRGPGTGIRRRTPARPRRNREGLTGFLALGGQLEFTPRHWFPFGDLALASIAFTLRGGRDADGPIDLHGTTAEVLRRQSNGTWKYLIDAPFAGKAD